MTDQRAAPASGAGDTGQGLETPADAALHQVHPAVAAFAQDARLEWHVGPDGHVHVSDGEVALDVVQDGEDVVVERTSRGSSTGTQLRTREQAAVDRYLVSWIGTAWREWHHLPRAYPAATATAPDATITESEDGTATLTWTQDGRTCTATDLNLGAAGRLARLLAHDVDALVASYRDPEGRPELVTG